MASVSSSTSSTSSMLGITGKGIGGLATGLDTDSLVDALISGTKSKIAKQGQQKQLLNWKMTAYRSMATALSAFQAKSLKVGSSGTNTNITSSAFFNTYKATSSSNAVSVSTTSNSVAGNFTINKVTQLAEAESYSSVKKLSSTLSTEFASGKTYAADAFSGQTLKLEATGFSTKTIKLDDLNGAIKSDGTLDLDKVETTLQTLIDKAYAGSRVVDVKLNGDKSQIILDSSSARITVNTANSLLGLSAGDTNRVNTDSKLGSLDAFKGIQGNTMTFKINGVEFSVNKNDTISSLMTKVNNSTADVRMEYDSYSDQFKLTSKKAGADSKIEMQDVHGNLLNEIFGAQGGNGIGTGSLVTGNSITSLNANTIDSMTDAQRKALISDLETMSFDMTVNGVTKTVKLDVLLGISAEQRANGKYTSEDVYKAINEGVQSAFYNSGIKFSAGDGGKTVLSTPNGDAINAKITGKLANLLGVSGSMTNIVSDYGYSKTIESSGGNITPASLGLTQSNPSAEFEMTVNGVTKTIKVSLDERDPTDEEKAKYLDDPLSADYDPNKKFYSEIKGDVFVARLNSAVKSAFGSDAVTFSANYVYNYETVNDLQGFDSGTTFEADSENPNLGVFKNADGDVIGTITEEYAEGIYVLEYEKEGSTVKTLVNANHELVRQDGSKITKDVKEMKLTLNTNDTGSVATKAVSMSGDFVEKLGFATTNTDILDGDGTVIGTVKEIKNSADGAGITLSGISGGKDMGAGTLTLANGNTVDYDKSMTLQDFIREINTALGDSGSAGIRDGKLYIESSENALTITDSNMTNGMLKSIFGISGGKYETSGASFSEKTESNPNGTYTAGKNAELEINGVKMAWSSNTISYNGVNLTLNEISSEEIKINVQSDPDDVVKRIQEWMDDYNALVFTLNSALNETKKSDYAPLTDEQKAEMTEDQIKTWETEAKKGLLRNDQTLRGILTEMRSALYQKVEAAGISLYDIGIVTKSGLSNPNEAGQLEFDKNSSVGGEERLRQMLTNDPDKVRTLFTDSANGIGVKLNEIITRAANESSVNRGTLVRIAGTEKLTGDNTSQLGNKIDALDTYIAALKSRMESEYQRYWKKFSALETAVQKMNTQSSWLTSQ